MQDAIVAQIRRTLARLRSRQEHFTAILGGGCGNAEATPFNGQADADWQLWLRTTQENTTMQYEMRQKQRLLVDREAEVQRMSEQVDDVRRQCKAMELQAESVATGGANRTARRHTTPADIERLQRRLEDLQKRYREQQVQLKAAKQRLGEDMAQSPQRTSATTQIELQAELEAVEEQKRALAEEAEACHVRHAEASAERRELEQRLQLLKLSREQLHKASADHGVEALSLREQLAQAKAECARHQQKAREDAAELARLRSQAAAATLSSSYAISSTLSPQQVSRIPEAQLDLAKQLEVASMQNEWLHGELQKLSTPRKAPGPSSPTPPETTPEAPSWDAVTAGLKHAEPELDQTILALEAQMKAMVAQNEALEQRAQR